MDRRAIKDDWKDRAPDSGIYAVRIGEGIWIGAAPRLGAARQRAAFTIPNGMARDPEMQRAYAAARTYGFEVLETFDTDISQLKRERLLKERLAFWLDRTGGRRI